uniref:Histocompatibility (minor) 13 n=1 Tax=Labrus bergylta TaxID=56723 RepID=A0A3Q3G0B6_9LABR
MPETITSRDAARFPIIASCTLFGLYLFFKVTRAFLCPTPGALIPLMSRIFPASFSNKQFQLLFTQGSGESKEEIVNYEFDTKNLVCLLISSVVGVWYLFKKHWIANNLFGLAFALNGVELLHLNNVSTGCILLGGLFVYDVFWVRHNTSITLISNLFSSLLHFYHSQFVSRELKSPAAPEHNVHICTEEEQPSSL